VVSPALAKLLASRDGALLRARFPGRVIGTIGHAGLQGPSELAFYRGSDRMPPDARRIARFGSATPHLELPPALLLLAVVALAALLMPVAVFIAAAARFGGEARDRRLAALRLVGADRAATVRVAAGESALGAIAGLAVGALVFLAGRGLIAHVTLWDISVFSADVRPSVPLAALVALAVPLTAVAATVLGCGRSCWSRSAWFGRRAAGGAASRGASSRRCSASRCWCTPGRAMRTSRRRPSCSCSPASRRCCRGWSRRSCGGWPRRRLLAARGPAPAARRRLVGARGQRHRGGGRGGDRAADAVSAASRASTRSRVAARAARRPPSRIASAAGRQAPAAACRRSRGGQDDRCGCVRRGRHAHRGR
jgi:hypothetical protein